MEKTQNQKKKLLMTDDSIVLHFKGEFCQILVTLFLRHFCSIQSEENLPKQHWMILHLVNRCLGMHDHRTAVPTNRCLGLLKRGEPPSSFCRPHPTASTDSSPATLSAQRGDLDLGMTSHTSWQAPFECDGRGKRQKCNGCVYKTDLRSISVSEWVKWTYLGCQSPHPEIERNMLERHVTQICCDWRSVFLSSFLSRWHGIVAMMGKTSHMSST